MRFLGLVILLCTLVPTLAFARMGGDGSQGRYRLSGFYGLTSVSPSDVNNYLAAQPTTPKLGSLTSGSVLGGEFGMMVSPRWEVEFAYDQVDVKNPTNTTIPSAANSGIELQQNDVWGGVGFYLIDGGPLRIKVDGLIGYPVYAHAILTSTTNSYYDASRQIVYQGNVTADFMFSRHFGVFLEGAYEFMNQGTLSNGNNLAWSGNSGVKMDLSGLRGQAGISIFF